MEFTFIKIWNLPSGMEFTFKYGIYLQIWNLFINMEFTFKYGIYL